MPIIYHSCEIHSRNINSRKKKSSAECNKLTSTTGNRAAIMGNISSNSCYNRERSHLFPYISSLYTQLQPKRNKKKKTTLLASRDPRNPNLTSSRLPGRRRRRRRGWCCSPAIDVRCVGFHWVWVNNFGEESGREEVGLVQYYGLNKRFDFNISKWPSLLSSLDFHCFIYSLLT